MELEELKMSKNLLWKFRVQYSDELTKNELHSISEIIALLITEIKK